METPDPATRFDSLVPWARRLYAEGKTRNEVMRAVYGVDLPAEAYAFWSACTSDRLDLPIERMAHPWDLIRASEPADQDAPAPWEREQEDRAFAQVPRFLPLMKLAADDAARYDDYIIGYDLDELSEGRTTVLGHHDDFPRVGAKLEPLGRSLLGVLHEWIASYLRARTEELRSPRNFGFGSIAQKDVDRVAAMLRAIKGVQREVGGVG